MKRGSLQRLFLIFCAFLTLILNPNIVHAQVIKFTDQNLEITVPDDTIVLTPDTLSDSPDWQAALVTDADSEKEEMDSMGVQAIFFDPNTQMKIRFLEKESTKSSDIFNLSDLSDEEVTAFLDELVASTEESMASIHENTTEENTDSSSESTVKDSTNTNYRTYQQREALFFRYEIVSDQKAVTGKEILYGTIVNGVMLWYDYFTDNTSADIDETYIQTLVDQTHFTKFMTKEEAKREDQISTIITILVYLGILLFLAFLIYLSRRKEKRINLDKKQRTAQLSEFFKDQKRKEEEQKTLTPIHQNHTTYSENIVKEFCYYNIFFKRMAYWIVTALLFILLLIFFYHSSSGLLKCGIAIIVVIAIAYFEGIQIEKYMKRSMQNFSSNAHLNMNILFYEDYFLFRDSQSSIKYSYIQVTDLRDYKDYLYLYISSDQAIYLKKDGFDCDYEAFKKFISSKIHIQE